MNNMMSWMRCWVLPRLQRMMPLAWWEWHTVMGGVRICMWDWTCAILPLLGVCSRPGVYSIRSSVWARYLIETVIYSKLACIQELKYFLFLLLSFCSNTTIEKAPSHILNPPSSISHPVHHRASNPYWNILPGWEGECSGDPAIVIWSKWLHGLTFSWVCLAHEKTVSASAAWKTDNRVCSHCNASTAW